MEKDSLNHDKIEPSKIIYGCMQLAGNWNNNPSSGEEISNTLKCIESALKNGINFFDHADIYARGRSEEIFSHAWEAFPGLRENIILQSKCGIRFENSPNERDPGRYDFSYDYIINSVEGSLRRLKTDRLDVLLLHRPDPLMETEEVAKAFDELYESGKVLNFGVSNHNAFQIDLLKKFINRPIIINQIEFNIIHNDLINEGVTVNQNEPANNLRVRGLVEYCRINEIEIQAWSPMAKGLLVKGNYDRQNSYLNKLHDVLNEMSEKYQTSKDAVALAWIMHHPAKIKPVIGSTKPERIISSCKANEIKLTREDWYKLFIAGRNEKMP